MPASLVDSQIAALKVPQGEDEPARTVLRC